MANVDYTEKLPLEVLEYIISFLDQETRKLAKLVSKKWCSACPKVKKIVIRDVYACWVDKILKLLTQSSNYIENIEFYCVSLACYQSSVLWKSCSHRIKSLLFYDTRISPEIFMNIVVKSPSLTHVSMSWKCLDYRHLAFIDQIICLMDDLIQKDQKNDGLVSLEVSVPESNSTRLLGNIFKVFPNLKILKISYWGHISREDEALIMSQTINWKEQLEVLSLQSENKLFFKQSNILLRTDLTRLKEIHFEITFETSIELVTGFIEKQLKLQHLDVEINSFMMFDKSEVLQDFVYSHKSCKNFKFFKLSYPMNLVWRSDWFVLLSKSSLHTLVLNCFHIEYIGYENSAISKTLRVLQLNETSPKSCKQYNSHIISFIKAFTDLEELRLAFVTAKIMNAVNQYQNGLRVFRTTNEWSRFGDQSNKMKPDILSLPNLVGIKELCVFSGNLDFLCNFLQYFRPHLQYLYVENGVRFKSFLKVLSNAPLLKTLIIKIDVSCFLEERLLFTKIVQSMTKLKHLWICLPNEGGRPQPCTEFAEQIFKECFSRRIFIFTQYVYFYNIIEKKVCVRKNGFNCIPSLTHETLDFKNNFLQM